MLVKPRLSAPRTAIVLSEIPAQCGCSEAFGAIKGQSIYKLL